ncbi:MAG: energy transducer TonB [Saprospiraceae bacterium]|nr:energy transducer TonB [Saprospiraceae bacterium]
MRRYLLFCILGLGTTVFAQDTQVYQSADGAVKVTCKAAGQHNLITGIERIDADNPLPEETEIPLGRYASGELMLHVHSRDTALYVFSGGERYYLYSTVVSQTEDEKREALMCLYKAVRYPAEARQRSVAGTVVVEVYLNALGMPTQTQPKTAIGAGLEQAAVSALQQCTYQPATFAGTPVKALSIVPVSFKLN